MAWVSFNYFRFMEFCESIPRYIQSNIRTFSVVSFFLLLVIYVRILQHGPRDNFDTKAWASNTNHFDDNLENMRHNLQYAVLIDAGSSGSRVYIYVWPPHSGDKRELLKIRLLHDKLGKDVFHSITPGLSSCAGMPSNASEYIAPLLQFAADNIPRDKHKETPLYILATAGMRLLPKLTQDAILDDLKNDIPKNFSFSFTEKSVEVISGKDEGIYSWISINYLMGRFDHGHTQGDNGNLITVEYDKEKMKRLNTISMIEMGGASTQIAFEISTNNHYLQLAKSFGDNFKSMISEFNLGCSEHDTIHKYRIFVTTYLTLGANAARSSYVNSLIHEYLSSQHSVNTSLTELQTSLVDPCLAIDSSETVNQTRRNPQTGINTTFLYHIRGTGNFETCQASLQKLITYDGLEWCQNTSCPYRDLSKLSVPFDETEFYGLSEFWYSMNDIFDLGSSYVKDKYEAFSKKFCSTSWLVTNDRWKRKLYPRADYRRLMYQCFKSAWITTLLHDGFHMPINYEHFSSVNLLKDEPVQWTLGALIYRTRYYPLRSLDSQKGVHIHHHGTHHSATNNYMQYFVFAGCMAAVIIAIIFLLKRLHSMTNKQNVPHYRPLNSADTECSLFEIEKCQQNVNDHKSIFIGL